MGYGEKLEEMKGLKAEKERLRKSLSAALSSIMAVRAELAKLAAGSKSAPPSPSPLEIAGRIERIEFAIATTAYTPAQEKRLLLALDSEKKALMRARAEGAAFRAIRSKRRELQGLQDAKSRSEALLSELLSRMSSLHAEIVKAGEGQRAQRREQAFLQAKREYAAKKKAQRQKESEPFMDKGDMSVNLMDAAIMAGSDKKKISQAIAES